MNLFILLASVVFVASQSFAQEAYQQLYNIEQKIVISGLPQSRSDPTRRALGWLDPADPFKCSLHFPESAAGSTSGYVSVGVLSQFVTTNNTEKLEIMTRAASAYGVEQTDYEPVRTSPQATILNTAVAWKYGITHDFIRSESRPLVFENQYRYQPFELYNYWTPTDTMFFPGYKRVLPAMAFVKKYQTQVDVAAAILAEHHPNFDPLWMKSILVNMILLEISIFDQADAIQDIGACKFVNCPNLTLMMTSFDSSILERLFLVDFADAETFEGTWNTSGYLAGQKKQGYGPTQIIWGLYLEALKSPIAEDYTRHLNLFGDENHALRDILEPKTAIYAKALTIDHALYLIERGSPSNCAYNGVKKMGYPYNFVPEDEIIKLSQLISAFEYVQYPEKGPGGQLPLISESNEVIASDFDYNVLLFMHFARFNGIPFRIEGIQSYCDPVRNQSKGSAPWHKIPNEYLEFEFFPAQDTEEYATTECSLQAHYSE